MAFTIKCPKCGAEMNMNSRVCPVCGKRRMTSRDKLEIILLVFLLLFGWFFISAMRATARRMDKTIMEGGAVFHCFTGAESAGPPVQENTWIIS